MPTRRDEGRGATAIAPYWDELAGGAVPADFTVPSMPARLEPLGREPWHGFERVR